jgi:hypothetical protein
MGPERGSLSFVITIEELLGRNSSGSGLENLDYGHGDKDGRSAGIVCLRIQATELFFKV